ncbi:hypothetical protein [Streptomyces sp. NPDC002889]|uniref:effector-associated constant component EACC1 n=1 Tax=Streptomyces sp. NPDC002889 TaxID=3364669 RepID=UPI0036B18854
MSKGLTRSRRSVKAGEIRLVLPPGQDGTAREDLRKWLRRERTLGRIVQPSGESEKGTKGVLQDILVNMASSAATQTTTELVGSIRNWLSQYAGGGDVSSVESVRVVIPRQRWRDYPWRSRLRHPGLFLRSHSVRITVDGAPRHLLAMLEVTVQVRAPERTPADGDGEE